MKASGMLRRYSAAGNDLSAHRERLPSRLIMGESTLHGGHTHGLAVGKLGIAGGSGVIRAPARAAFWQLGFAAVHAQGQLMGKTRGA
jgi:hypothetical protein